MGGKLGTESLGQFKFGDSEGAVAAGAAAVVLGYFSNAPQGTATSDPQQEEFDPPDPGGTME